MANEKSKTVLDEVLGDAAGVFTNPDPLNAMDTGMPSWMTDNLLDGPTFKKEEPKVEKSAKAPHAASIIISSEQGA